MRYPFFSASTRARFEHRGLAGAGVALDAHHAVLRRQDRRDGLLLALRERSLVQVLAAHLTACASTHGPGSGRFVINPMVSRSSASAVSVVNALAAEEQGISLVQAASPVSLRGVQASVPARGIDGALPARSTDSGIPVSRPERTMREGPSGRTRPRVPRDAPSPTTPPRVARSCRRCCK